jgi:hypothetical protein
LCSEHVQRAVSVFFGRFQPFAEIQKLMLRRATVQLVDGPAHVANQAFEFETVQRDEFDVMTRLSGLQGMLDLCEWISILHQQGAFFSCQLNLYRLSRHGVQLCFVSNPMTGEDRCRALRSA